ncbi:MAG: DUF2853 family protein [Sphingomonadaceae bacterium]|nr:DUF2853 family protein [Sphingomonadaceae bacterium]
MATDWAADVKKYAAKADDAIIAGIVRYCGIALSKPDSALVAFSDPKELARVRNNFLKKKLGRTESDADLDAAIAKVGTKMKADRTKNRVTVYYLLAAHYKALDLFAPKTKAAKAAPAAAEKKPAKAAPAAAEKKPAKVEAPAKKPAADAKPAAEKKPAARKAAPAKAAPARKAAAAPAAATAPQTLAADPVAAPQEAAPAPAAEPDPAAPAAAAVAPAPAAKAAPASRPAAVDVDSGLGWLWWVLALLVLAFLAWWLLG